MYTQIVDLLNQRYSAAEVAQMLDVTVDQVLEISVDLFEQKLARLRPDVTVKDKALDAFEKALTRIRSAELMA